MARNTKPRLGRGLSSLMNEPVPVVAEVKPSASAPALEESRASAAETDPLDSRPDTEPTSQGNDRVLRISLDDIIPNKYQPRSPIQEDELQGLAASIQATGLMQPIAVRLASSGGAGRYELIAGERRWRAARLAGLEHIPAIVHEVDDRQSAEWAIIENVQREDLNPIDRGHAYANLSSRFGLTQGEIAERVGVDRSTVANLIRLLDLEPEIRDLVAQGRLSTGHGKALLAMPAGALRIETARSAADRQQTVRALEAIAASHREDAQPSQKQGQAKQNQQVVAAIEDLAKGIGEHLGTKVRIRTRDGVKGTLEIEFYDLDHFDGLMQRIGYSSR